MVASKFEDKTKNKSFECWQIVALRVVDLVHAEIPMLELETR
jgi:hypothetical protein